MPLVLPTWVPCSMVRSQVGCGSPVRAFLSERRRHSAERQRNRGRRNTGLPGRASDDGGARGERREPEYPAARMDEVSRNSHRGVPPRRVERDSMGPLEVPEGAYYGASTRRAYENFP